MKKLIILLPAFMVALTVKADYWQQRVEYTMEIDLDVTTHQFEGQQRLVYYNNSPDTLKRVFYHLYFNAFQPGSMMDVRARNIEDPDSRIGNRISRLSADQQGYHHIDLIRQDGKKLKYRINGTVMEVTLAKPIMPGAKSVFEMKFNSQVPLQIRRSGRQNAEGIDYSMAQWYPKMAEYDEDGWHPDPYVFREYYGVWGSFDVKITIDSSFTIGGTGVLQNPTEIGHGYCKESEVGRKSGSELTWHFKADKVHDFVWAADPEYKHRSYQMKDGPMLHFFYKASDTLTKHWKEFPGRCAKGFEYLSEHFGKYPYPQYSVIQGGDGGMEYPMATLITGRRKPASLFGVTMHEAAHSWYQMLLGSNESRYPWMDEGFTNYAGNEAFSRVMYPNGKRDPHTGAFKSYFDLVKSGKEEPMSTHADHYNTNYAYGQASYSKGELFLVQMKYIVGEETFNRGIKRYFREWSYRHPAPEDFVRIMEKESGMVLDWYLQYWMNSTKTIDYSVKGLKGSSDKSIIVLERSGLMPMPVEVTVEFTNGKSKTYYIPLGLMNGTKDGDFEVLPSWAWTNPTYDFEIKYDVAKIQKVYLNQEHRLADVNAQNDSLLPDHDYQYYYIRD